MRSLSGLCLFSILALAAAGCGGGGGSTGSAAAAPSLAGRLLNLTQQVQQVLVGGQPVTVSAGAAGQEFSLDGARTAQPVPVVVTLADGSSYSFTVSAAPAAQGSVQFDLAGVSAQSTAATAGPGPSDGAGWAKIAVANGASIQGTPTTGPAFFTVSGTASGVLGSPTNAYRVYLLVNPARALGGNAGWYVQFPSVTVDATTGTWTAQARVGNDEWAATPGERFSMCAVVCAGAVPATSRPFEQPKLVRDENGNPPVFISPQVRDLIYQPLQSVVLFGETFEAGWQDWSWPTAPVPVTTAQAHSGTHSLQGTLASWGGLSFGNLSALDLRQYRRISFWIHGGATGGQQLRVLLRDPSDHDFPNSDGLPLNNSAYIENGTIDAGVWKPVVIPLVDLGAANATLEQLSLKDATGAGQPTFYVDDVMITP